MYFYENYHKVKNDENGGNNIPTEIRRVQKNMSCMFPILSNLSQTENIKSSPKDSDNGVDMSIIQKIFSFIFYGNPNYYNLPNAW